MARPVKTIMAYGAALPLNLGGPSIFHGAVQAWRHVFPDCAITYLQPQTRPGLTYVAEPGWPGVEVIEVPRVSGRQWLACLAKTRMAFGSPRVGDPASGLVQRVRSADLLINIWGIEYCTKLSKRNLRGLLVSDPLVRIARRFGVLTVHYTASYGPINDLPTRLAARWILGRKYDLVYCREIESQRALLQVGVKAKTLVCPDTGLLLPKGELPTEYVRQTDKPVVGISVSHQIMRHWTATEPYLDVVARFCQSAVKNWQASIILFPNEIIQPGERNDTRVARRIQELAQLGCQLRIFPAEQFTAGQQKAVIGTCEILVASRYHAVVAGLSSGVPCVVVGWHYKYTELLGHYDQASLCLTAAECNSERLWRMAQNTWERREQLREEITGKHAAVVDRVLQGALRLREIC